MAVIVEDGRLTLTGYVGESSWEWEGTVVFDGFTHGEVLAALRDIGDDTDLIVHINSGGGYAYEGAAIRSALARRKGRTDVVIDGIAASAASVIAMAGETISMALGSTMMVHDPSGLTMGTVADHEAQIRSLNSLGGTMASVYAERSGKSKDECREIMKAETWFEPEEAVAAGFADAVLGNKAQPVAAFPYQHYAHAPRQLVAMAKDKGWRQPPSQIAATAAVKPAAPAASTSPQEESMADPNPAGAIPADIQAAVAADRARRTAILALPEAQGRTALAEHLHAETDMTVDQAKAALAAAPEPAASGPAAPAVTAAEPPAEPVADVAAYEASRLAGAGLGNKPSASTGPRAQGRLAAKMTAMLAKEGK